MVLSFGLVLLLTTSLSLVWPCSNDAVDAQLEAEHVHVYFARTFVVLFCSFAVAGALVLALPHQSVMNKLGNWNRLCSVWELLAPRPSLIVRKRLALGRCLWRGRFLHWDICIWDAFVCLMSTQMAPPGSSWLLLAPGCLLAPPGSSWLLLAPPGSSWLLLAPLAPPGSSWLLDLGPPGSLTWVLMGPPGSSWLPQGSFLAPPGSSWLLLAPPGSSWLLLAPPCFFGSSWLLLGAPSGP